MTKRKRDNDKRTMAQWMDGHPKVAARVMGTSFGGWLSAKGLDLGKLKIRVEGEEGEIDVSSETGRSRLLRLVEGVSGLSEFVQGAFEGLVAHAVFEIADQAMLEREEKRWQPMTKAYKLGFPRFARDEIERETVLRGDCAGCVDTCGAIAPGDHFCCTRAEGHDGDHVSHHTCRGTPIEFDPITARWPQER